MFLCLGDRNHRERSGTRTDRERSRSAVGERLAGDKHGSKAKKKSKKRQAPSASSSDSEHEPERSPSLAKKKKKEKRETRKEPEPTKGKNKNSKASTWDMLAYLWPVASRPAHLQREEEVNRCVITSVP